MYYNSLSDIVEEYKNSEVRVISFDIFDTLLLRPFRENDKFALLDKKFHEISDAHVSFAKLRTMAEAWLRRRIIGGERKREDMDIREIYDVIQQRYHIPKTITDEMLQEEYRLELRYCYPRKSGKYLYEKAKQTGKTVILVTDMYLSKEQIGRLLNENGYDDYFALYVSSQVGLRKNSGNLYRHIMDELQVLPGEIFHIGDNRESDYGIPLSLGMRAVWFKSTMEAYHEHGCGNQVTKICRDLTNWEAAKTEHGISIMEQMTANRYFDNPYRAFDEESDYNGDPYFVGYGALGIEVLALVNWLKDNIVRDHIQKMIFLSRDGYLPMMAYQILQSYDKALPEAIYLHTSRIALLPVMIKEKEDLFDLPVDIHYQNPIKIISLLEFCSKTNSFTLMKQGHPQSGYEAEKSFTPDSFQEFISDFIQYGYDKEKHEDSKRLVKAYLNRIMEDGDAIFDMGYSGRIAGAILEATQKNVHIYYFHTDGKRVYEEERIHDMKVRAFLDFSPYMESTLREYAYLEPAASCIGYGQDGTLLFDEGPSQGYTETVAKFQQGAMDFIKEYMDYFSSYEKETAFRHHNGAMPFEAFLRHCSDADKKMFAAVNIDDELWGGRRDINLLNLMERRLEKMPEYATVYKEKECERNADSENGCIKQKDVLWEASLNWYEFKRDSRTLLIDSYRDNLIDLLCRRCKRVTVLVDSRKRMAQLEEVYKDVEHLNIVTEPEDCLYDYVVAMDVMEYKENPCEWLKLFLPYLAKQGRFLLSCDNRYGLQYFCGCREKHTGIPYVGINDYYNNTSVEYDKEELQRRGRSFSKQQLEAILQSAGCVSYKFYYPVPDDKMPQMIFTDAWKNGVNITERLVDYHYCDSDMQGIEHRIFKDVIEAGALPFLSNSYIVEISPEGEFLDLAYGVVTTDRGKEYGMATTVRTSHMVYKRPLWNEGEAQLRKLHAYTEELEKDGVPVVQGFIREDEAGVYLEMPFVEGENLSCVLDRFIAEDEDAFFRIFDRIYEAIQKSFRLDKESQGRVFLDLAPCNCFYLPDAPEEERLLFYDQEFVTDDASPEYAMFRTIKYYFASSVIARSHMENRTLYNRYGIETDMLKSFEEKERDFIQNIRNKDQYDWLFRAATPDYKRMYQRNSNLIAKKTGKPYHVGYVPGVFDLFHTGHLKLIERCKERCDYLIVGVLTDELVEFYKGKKPIITYEDRAYVINGLAAVDEVIPVDFTNTDKLDAWNQIHFDCHFSGDDHANHWNDIWEELKKRGSNMEFFSYTQNISSTQIKEKMKNHDKG